jgi:hypothetical protein
LRKRGEKQQGENSISAELTKHEEAELEEFRFTSLAGTIGSVASEGGSSARVRPRSSAEQAVPLLQLKRVQEPATRLFTRETQESSSLPAKAGSNVHGPSNLFQLNIINEGCFMGSHVSKTWQETHNAVDSVVEVAERRHPEVMANMTSVAEQNRRAEVVQLTGEAVRALGEQASRYADATERLRREAAANHDDIAISLSAKPAAEDQARVVHAEMMRVDFLKERN